MEDGDAPVRTHDGYPVWRVRVSVGERTCLGCGETFAADGYCVVCALTPDGKRRKDAPASVLTQSYLRDGEWER